MAIYPNSDEGRRRRSEFNDPRDAQAQGLTRYAEGPGATPNQKWNNTRAKVFDAALYPFAKLDRAMGGSGSMTPLQDDLRKERFAANDTALRAPRADVSNAQGSPAPGAAASDPKKPRTPEDINKIFENARLSMAKQAAGVGSVDLGAGNMGQRWEGQKYDQRLVDDMAGGGLKRNSLASSIGKFGEPVYDNASISRMLARDAGPGGWNVKNYSGAQEATRILQRRGSPSGPSGVAATGGGGVALPASSGGAGNRGAGGTGGQSGDSFGGYAGFRGQGGDPQARDIRGDLFGADSERKGAIENLDLAIKSLTSENGGLNMRSKRDLYGQLLRQRSEMSGMPYEVQNSRDLAGAKMSNDMASQNADRGLEREKFSWDREKFGIDRQDRAAAANQPMSIKEQLELRIMDANARRAEDQYAIGRDSKLDEGFNKTVEQYMKLNPGASYQEASSVAEERVLQGNGPISPAMRAAQRQRGDSAEAKLNEGTGFLEDAYAWNFRAPFSQKTLDPKKAGTLTENDLEYTPTGGVLGMVNSWRGKPTYDVTPKGSSGDSRSARYRVPAAEAQSTLRRQNIEAERKRRAERGE